MMQIDELILRIPEMSVGEARQVGAQVTQSLALQLPENSEERRTETLNIRLSLPSGLSTDQISEVLTAQILRQLKFK